MRVPRLRFWLVLGASLLLALSVALPLAVQVNRGVRRAMHVGNLDAADPAARERALNFIIRHAGDDPRLVEAVAERLGELADDQAVQAYNALRLGGVADQAVVRTAMIGAASGYDDAAFVRVLEMLSPPPMKPDERLIAEAVRRYRDAGPTLRDKLFHRLDERRVWASPPVPLDLFVERLLASARSARAASRAAVARRLADLPIAHEGMDVEGLFDPVAALLGDEEASVRLAALYAAANLSGLDDAFGRLIGEARQDAEAGIAAMADRMWVAMSGRGSEVALSACLGSGAKDAPPLPPFPAVSREDGEVDAVDERAWHDVLEALEAQPAGSLDLAFDPALPHLLRPAAVRAAERPEAAWLLNTLRHDDRPALRDWACVVAAERFDRDTLEALIVELLTDYDPQGRMSGAMLSGLTGLGTRLLQAAAEAESRFAVHHMMRVGLWMQGSGVSGVSGGSGGAGGWVDGVMPAMLHRRGLPSSSLLLAMLHVGDGGLQREALDYLFGPRGMDDAQLTHLLGRERWAHVLQACLPPGAPRLPLWVDGEAFADRLDAMRAWHAVHRYAP